MLFPSLRFIKGIEKKQRYLTETCAYNRWKVLKEANFFWGEKHSTQMEEQVPGVPGIFVHGAATRPVWLEQTERRRRLKMRSDR